MTVSARKFAIAFENKSALQKFLLGPKINLRGRRLPAEPLQMPRGSRIAAATAGERGIAAVLAGSAPP
jgi:hypothetical protein